MAARAFWSEHYMAVLADDPVELYATVQDVYVGMDVSAPSVDHTRRVRRRSHRRHRVRRPSGFLLLLRLGPGRSRRPTAHSGAARVVPGYPRPPRRAATTREHRADRGRARAAAPWDRAEAPRRRVGDGDRRSARRRSRSTATRRSSPSTRASDSGRSAGSQTRTGSTSLGSGATLTLTRPASGPNRSHRRSIPGCRLQSEASRQSCNR